MNAHNYILKNWKRTVRNPENKEDSKLALLKLPCIYTTPCADEMFKNFFYWDTYFTNLGLLEDGEYKIAKCNADIMKFLVNKLGFIPNADYLIFGSQPPFYARTVYDIYRKTNDINVIKDHIESILKEFKFWENERKTDIGLNQYRCGYSNTYCIESYDSFVERVSGLTESEKKIDKISFTKGFFAICESGWDMTSRFERDENRFSSLDFVEIDLNSILYDAEMKTAELLKIIGRENDSIALLNKAKTRKELINKYCLDNKSKIYYDYCFADKTLSRHLSAASFYPYAFGISDDKEGFIKVFNRLMFEFGLSVGEKDKDGVYFQWEYPNMWPPVVYIAYIAAKNLNLTQEAERIKKAYMNSLENTFAETGSLWEKYDSTTGKVSYNPEYKTPKMLGWTAGVYEYLKNN